MAWDFEQWLLHAGDMESLAAGQSTKLTVSAMLSLKHKDGPGEPPLVCSLC